MKMIPLVESNKIRSGRKIATYGNCQVYSLDGTYYVIAYPCKDGAFLVHKGSSLRDATVAAAKSDQGDGKDQKQR